MPSILDSDDPSGPTVSYRPSHVARAREVLANPNFDDDIRAHVDTWNRQHPEFKIRWRVVTSSTDSDRPRSLPMPPRLTAILRRAKAGLDACQTAEEFAAFAEHCAFGDEPQPINAWFGLVLGLCHKWWPSPEYPNWLGAGDHPAATVVAASLVLAPSRARADWIAGGTLTPYRLPFDPSNPDSHPIAQAMLAFATSIRTAVAAETPSERLAQIEYDAALAARRAHHAATCVTPSRRSFGLPRSSRFLPTAATRCAAGHIC